MSQPINEAWRGMFKGGKHGQHGAPGAITVITPASAKNSFAIHRYGLEIVGHTWFAWPSEIHLVDSVLTALDPSFGLRDWHLIGKALHLQDHLFVFARLYG
jgi:hypothetical protein